MAEFTLNLMDVPFELGYTLESGQTFRWTLKNGWWYGVVSGGVMKARQEGYSLYCESSRESLDSRFAHSYFRLDDDFAYILSSIAKDPVMSDAVQSYRGLRLLRQDVWECLVSFVMSTNANIPRIRGMVSNLAQMFGEEVEFEGVPYRLFPTADRLSGATIEQLTECGLGYRAKFVRHIAQVVSSGRVNLDELRLQDYPRAKDILLERIIDEKTFLGIGHKVADCILLFSCEKNEAFPIDVWIARALARFYPRLFSPEVVRRLNSKLSRKGTLTDRTYEEIARSARDYFGSYAGYAQQYLYHYARMGAE